MVSDPIKEDAKGGQDVTLDVSNAHDLIRGDFQVGQEEFGAASKDYLRKRRTHRRNMLENGFLGFVFLIMAVLVVLIVVVASHWVLPEGYTWLSDKRLEDLEDTLFNGLAGVVISNLVVRYLALKEDA